jgi:predicted dehydrogenase
MAVNARKQWPDAPYYRDYRELLDKEGRNIDAVIITTPDHMHAPIAMAAMEMRKHVYCEKPLTHDIAEARQLTEAARKYKVVTQMGNQGSSGNDTRLVETWIQSGVLGHVHTGACLDQPPLPGHKVCLTPAAILVFPKNWTGTYGWVQPPTASLIQSICPPTGAAG